MIRTPAPLEVRVLLEDLLTRPVDVYVATPWTPDPDEEATFAVYADDCLRVRSTVMADLALSAYLASSIALLPVLHARCAITGRRLTEELQENLDEVLDICAAPQNGGCIPRTTLYRVHHVGDARPDWVAALGAVVGRRLDVVVRISGYGAGRLSFAGIERLPC